MPRGVYDHSSQKLNAGNFGQGRVHPLKGKKRNPESIIKMVETRKKEGSFQRTAENIKKLAEFNTGKPRSEETKLKIKKALIGKARLERRGKNCYLWRGGTTPVNKQIRNGLEYKIWRRAVFERDNYTCVWCGERGGDLNADHIKPFALYPELRFAIDNGRTLCIACHKTTDTYAGKTRKKI